MVHETFDLARWTTVFSLERLRQEARDFVAARCNLEPNAYPNEDAVERHIRLMEPRYEIITGPRHIAVTEQLRAEQAELRMGEVATDVFIFAQGEPTRAEVTKIGGRAFWPASKPWPVDDQRQPMSWIGQINFADSIDLVPELPGSLLVVLSRAGTNPSLEARDYVGVWLTAAEVRQARPLDAAHTTSPCYGLRHRTVDYGPGSTSPMPARGAVLQATKIGGLPSGLQNSDPPDGRYIASINSVHPERRSWPFVNREAPLKRSEGRGYLMFGDVGVLDIYLTRDGTVAFCVECH